MIEGIYYQENVAITSIYSSSALAMVCKLVCLVIQFIGIGNCHHKQTATILMLSKRS